MPLRPERRTTRLGLDPTLPQVDFAAGKRSDASAADVYEGHGHVANVEAGDEGPALHKLVGDLDPAGIRKLLKDDPKAIDKRNAVGDAALHLVADQGAVMLAELFDEKGADPRVNDRRGLMPGHRAAEKHPRTAAFLIDRAAASDAVEGPVLKPAELSRRIADASLDSDKAIDKLAASLCGVTVGTLNSARQVVKNRTHLEEVKGTILELKAEAWWQAEFGPQRVRALLSAIAETAEKGEPVPGARKVLEREIGVQLDMLRTIRRVRAMARSSSPMLRRSAMKLEARLVTPRILDADHEVALALGWKGHAIYGGFTHVPPNAEHPEATLLVRVDNRGSGAKLAHEKTEEGDVVTRAFHVPVAYLETPKGRAAFEGFVADLLLTKATPDSKGDDFYAHVATFKRAVKEATKKSELVESTHGVVDQSTLPAQIAGNCVVANTFPGLSSRLGPELYTWFTEYERDLARDLVGEFADPNTLIDQQCLERDQRQIEKVLDGDGPWAERLSAILGAATYAGVEEVANEVTADHLEAVIEHGDHEALKLLLEHGAPLEARGHRDRSPLHMAARLGHDKCVKVLLAAGASLTARDDEGNTPLHLAVKSSSSSSVAQLLAKGADRDLENDAGESPRSMIEAQVGQTMLIAKSLGVESNRGRRQTPFGRTGT
ncbi:MAG: ankyrin repeat domain-containing protein [Deltaproteobacteria bacterium]|jgi:ankyrin repeat protein